MICPILFVSCTREMYVRKIQSYLNTSAISERAKYQSESFHSYFEEKKGGGKDKATALKSFENWDGPMNPDIQIYRYTVKHKTWMIWFNEQNDFTKAIGYPGWKGSMSITFDRKGLLEETIYFPDSTNAPYKPFLLPAIEWLRKNRPEELNEVYRDNKLIQTTASANKWKVLLNTWKQESKK